MPTTKRIQKVLMNRFRGASRSTEIQFDVTKPLALVFGENGTGKTSLVDAIDFLCNQEAGSIKERSSTNIQQLVTIGASPSDLGVEIQWGGQSCSAGLNRTGIVIAPDATPPSATILRRGGVLKLVAATPAKRFEELKKFIDVENVEKCEGKISDAIKEVKQSLEGHTHRLQEAKDNLEKCFEEEKSSGETETDAILWARKRSEADLSALEAQNEALKNILTLYQTIQVKAGIRDHSQAVYSTAKQKFEEVEKRIQEAPSLDAQTGVSLVELLSKAQEHLQPIAYQTDSCPICLQPKNGTELLSEITTRLQEMSQIRSLVSEKTSAEQALKTAQATAIRDYAHFVKSVQATGRAIAQFDTQFTKNFPIDNFQFPLLFAFEEEVSRALAEEVQNYLEQIEPLAEHLRLLQDSLYRQITQANLIKREYKAHVDAEREAKKALAVRGKLEETLKTVRQTRIAFVQRVLDQVADECDRLYARIHQEERIGRVRLTLDEERKGSLQQKGEFQGYSDVSPQAYFSDSHLDTLAFCFFLSVAKQMTGGQTILVLDDVFTAVDLDHIRRIVDLLIEEAPEFHQVIFTTYQRRWLNLMQASGSARNLVQTIELLPWSLESGITSNQIKPYVEELRELLQSRQVNRRDIGSLSGFLVESLLDEMTKRCQCSLQRNPDNRYTGLALLDGFTSRSRRITVQRLDPTTNEMVNKEVVPDSDQTLAGVIEFLKRTWQDARNLNGDHFNWDSADVSNATIQEFGRKTLTLADYLCCEHCGSLPVRDRTTHLACQCNKTQIMKTW